MDKYKQYLIKHIAQRNSIDENEIDINLDIFENSYIDSIGIFTLLVEIEDDLGIILDLEDISSLELYSINKIAFLMESKCQ